MKTVDVYKLLLEASFSSTSENRLNEIHVELCGAIKAGNCEHDNLRIEGLKLAFDCIFSDTLENNRKLLPSLLPAFAILCGNCADSCIIGDADWDFINAVLK